VVSRQAPVCRPGKRKRRKLRQALEAGRLARCAGSRAHGITAREALPSPAVASRHPQATPSTVAHEATVLAATASKMAW